MSTQPRNKLYQITQDLKRSLMRRKPTQLPFQNIPQQAANLDTPPSVAEELIDSVLKLVLDLRGRKL
ncbi:unnamed protein product [Didymodactylos carnosus]|uniref:Uncharacterized protein n=1 Tax=Didymodactylos carnosus TaxID=1234261 RepID=A0A816CGB7_9BILA|nr:unnamed protein product [Didymodactylos carnosus]CAF1624423.1 unnamed protein product [Didymodactylos carnosus]CAF4345043.1 unnamed protein product [Didymodactylos carnosus]CAF4517212.1 unnamed protein product [Didymodactylos carnosus]